MMFDEIVSVMQVIHAEVSCTYSLQVQENGARSVGSWVVNFVAVELDEECLCHRRRFIRKYYSF